MNEDQARAEILNISRNHPISILTRTISQSPNSSPTKLPQVESAQDTDQPTNDEEENGAKVYLCNFFLSKTFNFCFLFQQLLIICNKHAYNIYCGVTLVSSGCVVHRVEVFGPSLRCLGGFRSPCLFDGTSRSAVRDILDFPQSIPVPLLLGRSTASPTTESSTTAVQVHRGGSNPLTSL